MGYETITVRFQDPVCVIKLNRPEANNTINSQLIRECSQVLTMCQETIRVVVLEGLPEVFCMGADFQEIHHNKDGILAGGGNPQRLYQLWLQMATGPYVVISHVRGKANAGGIGFIAASDLVIADPSAEFSLSELLFGLLPACVMPFLIRRIGLQKARYMTGLTSPITALQGRDWGLVDKCQERSQVLLRQYIAKLSRMPKEGIRRYNSYMSKLDTSLIANQHVALETNEEVFSDEDNLHKIFRYVTEGKFPWE